MCTLLYVFVYGFLVHGPMGPSQWEITLTISVIVVVIVVFDMFLYSYNFHLSFSFFYVPLVAQNPNGVYVFPCITCVFVTVISDPKKWWQQFC